MIKSFFSFAFLLFTLLLLLGFAPPTNEQLLQKVLKAVKEFDDKEFPNAMKAKVAPLGSYTEADFARRAAFYKTQIVALNKINVSKISSDSRISLDLMKFVLDNDVQEFEFKQYLNPILTDDGFHISFAGRATRNYTSLEDLNGYIRMLKDFPRYTEQYLALMRKGLELGICQPAEILKGYENTYNQHIVKNVEESLFFNPFQKKPYGISEEQWQKLVAEGKQAIGTDVVPTYEKIKQFFEQEYFPKTRKTYGVLHFPNGKEYYQQRVHYYTTTDLTVEEVHQLGLQEVERIQKEMQAVLKEVNFQGSLQDFIQFLRTDPQFYAKTPEGLLKEASFIAKKVDAKLPSLFGKLPRQSYGVAPVPDHIAPTYTGGRYVPANVKSRNSGTYWVNTYNLPSRPLYVLESLTLHEAVPGHHLQMALTQELDSLPEFRRNLYINAFGEGWGLYAEYLGNEMGFYSNPYSRFGRLTYEMWRACRLVIDTGIHGKDWSREQAVDYLASHTALSLHEVNTEINRYIAWPGQALSYKMGELKIKELRKKAEAKLGDKFDVRAFHDMLLSEGTVTLDIMEKMVDEFIVNQRSR